jgi:xylose isomerase
MNFEVAGAAGALGSIDANTGDDADRLGHRPVPDRHLPHHADACSEVLKYGGFTTGGVNFDAKVRRESFEPIDLFYAHIGGMDAFARGLKIAHAVIADGRLDAFKKERYSSFDSGIGAKIEKGEVGFEELEAYTFSNGDPVTKSGRQEMLENLINEFI